MQKKRRKRSDESSAILKYKSQSYENILTASLAFVFYYTGHKYFWVLLHLCKLSLN